MPETDAQVTSKGLCIYFLFTRLPLRRDDRGGGGGMYLRLSSFLQDSRIKLAAILVPIPMGIAQPHPALGLENAPAITAFNTPFDPISPFRLGPLATIPPPEIPAIVSVDSTSCLTARLVQPTKGCIEVDVTRFRRTPAIADISLSPVVMHLQPFTSELGWGQCFGHASLLTP